jgi:hypothetical protein
MIFIGASAPSQSREVFGNSDMRAREGLGIAIVAVSKQPVETSKFGQRLEAAVKLVRRMI